MLFSCLALILFLPAMHVGPRRAQYTTLHFLTAAGGQSCQVNADSNHNVKQSRGRLRTLIHTSEAVSGQSVGFPSGPLAASREEGEFIVNMCPQGISLWLMTITLNKYMLNEMVK